MEINQEGKWLSIIDYAKHKDISISSVRRRIKAGRVKYKLERGKYFIWTKNYSSRELIKTPNIEELEKNLQELKEENQELRMLVKLYEKRLFNQRQKNETPPEIPLS